jgi:hypothetical protein
MPPYAPHLYNTWMGNRFVVPPLGQYARPVYAEAVAPVAMADPALAAAVPQAVPDRPMMGDAGFQGAAPGSAPGVGMNAQANSFGDFARSAVTGPVTAFGSLVGQAAINAMTGRPDRPIERIGLMDLGRNVAETLGIGGGRGVDTGAFQGPNIDGSTVDRAFQGPNVDGSVYGGPVSGEMGGNDAGYGPEAQAAAEARGYEGSGMYAKGGKVNMLLGPNPPGPDDGYAGLDRGEYVIRKNAADHYGKGLLDALNERKIDKRKLKGLLE